jgi:hypothetical protein
MCGTACASTAGTGRSAPRCGRAASLVPPVPTEWALLPSFSKNSFFAPLAQTPAGAAWPPPSPPARGWLLRADRLWSVPWHFPRLFLKNGSARTCKRTMRSMSVHCHRRPARARQQKEQVPALAHWHVYLHISQVKLPETKYGKAGYHLPTFVHSRLGGMVNHRISFGTGCVELGWPVNTCQKTA